MDGHKLMGMLILYVLFLGFLSYHLPFSMFFNLLHEEESLRRDLRKANRLQTDKSLKYFSSLNSSSSLAHYKLRLKGQPIDIAIGIITIKRTNAEGKQESFGYLLQSAAAIDVLLKEKAVFNNSVAFICNVNSNPSKHTDAVQLYPYLPYIERYGGNSLGISQLLLPRSHQPFHEITTHTTLHEKETYDYAMCLQAAAKLNPKFILLLEEDTLPHPAFADFMDHLMKIRLKHYHLENIAYVKLFFHTKGQGFFHSITGICDLVSCCLLGATVFCLVDHYCYSFNLFTNAKTYKVFILGLFISLLTCCVLERQNLNRVRRLSNFLYRMKMADDSYTQAVLFPIHVMDRLPQFMVSKAQTSNTDFILADFIRQTHLSALQIEPNLFYHTGYRSSLHSANVHPQEFF